MKVFFYASPTSSSLDSHKIKMYKEISRLGYMHTNKEVESRTVRDVLKNIQENKPFDKKIYNESIKALIDSVSQADICIFEASFQSLGLGYLIDKSLDACKPTIVLYKKGNQPHILSVIEDEKLVVKEYDEKNLLRVLKGCLEEAREKRDKRFNFFLSPKLLQYIDDVAKEQGITKSKLIRDMIVKHMREKGV